MDFSIGAPMETVTLTSIGRNRQIYLDMLEEGEVQLLENLICAPSHSICS